MKKSTFKRVTSETFPTSVPTFLQEAGYKFAGTGVLAAWIKGDAETSKDLVVVMVNDEDADTLNDVLARNAEGKIEVVPCESMYQTFLAHKAARFANEEVETPVAE